MFSLAAAIERALKQFEGLRSYFFSESCEQTRFIRLENVFGKAICEIYLLLLGYSSCFLIPSINFYKEKTLAST